MFNSSILDVIIGLVFCFASVALFVSSINEALASFLKLRHKTLLAGLQKMLNDPAGTGLVKSLYEHALIDPMSLTLPPVAATIDGAALAAPAPPPAPNPPPQVAVTPTWPAWASGRQLPAYIASQDFAHALIDIIRTAPQASSDLKADIAAVADPQLRQALQGFYARAQGNVEQFGDAIANWFDNAMDRLSGAYKRKAQAWTFAIAFVASAGLNIDAFYVLDQLWKRPEMAAAVVSPASAQLIAAGATPADAAASQAAALTPRDVMATLNTLPVGWAVDRKIPGGTGAAIRFWLWWIFGVAITASAAVFGAPFWFDLLQQLIQVRGTGAKPATHRDRRPPDGPGQATAGG